MESRVGPGWIKGPWAARGGSTFYENYGDGEDARMPSTIVLVKILATIYVCRKGGRM